MFRIEVGFYLQVCGLACVSTYVGDRMRGGSVLALLEMVLMLDSYVGCQSCQLSAHIISARVCTHPFHCLVVKAVVVVSLAALK